MSDYLPITPDEITEQAVGAAEAGAAILHLHARDPRDGRPTADPGVFMQFLPQIKERCGAIVNITTGGAPGMSIEQRVAAARRAAPELTSLNKGTFNFGTFQAVQKIQVWKHEWEKPFLEASPLRGDEQYVRRDRNDRHRAVWTLWDAVRVRML